MAKLRDAAEDEKRDAADGQAKAFRHDGVRQFVQHDGGEEAKRAGHAHGEVNLVVLVRQVFREIARCERQHEIEREEEPGDVDADAEAQQRKKMYARRKHNGSSNAN